MPNIPDIKKINPKITQEFIDAMSSKTEKDRLEFFLNDRKIFIDVFPKVFPPSSDFSVSSKLIFENVGGLNELDIADIGCGTGIQSIVSAFLGANHIDASDISPEAINCSNHNILLNGLENKINVFHSDLFNNFPNKKYDLIIANLPIVDFDAEDNYINNSLYDRDMILHKRLFDDAKKFLKKGGKIVFSHANLQSANSPIPDYDFQILDSMIKGYGYKIVGKIEKKHLDYSFIFYTISL